LALGETKTYYGNSVEVIDIQPDFARVKITLKG